MCVQEVEKGMISTPESASRVVKFGIGSCCAMEIDIEKLESISLLKSKNEVLYMSIDILLKMI